MLHAENLWKAFDKLVAVENVSLEVSRGETMGIIGSNGAGKTTLLRMFSTLAKPDIGTLRINGKDAVQNPLDARLTLAFMPAEFGVPRDMTMREYMQYFACLVGMSGKKAEKMIDQAFDLTDLAGRDDVLVGGLSTGNKQRLLLAKTLLNDPDLLILDEPASGLDPRARVEVREILQELAGMGKAIIISSHILRDLENICSHICVMEEGKIVLDGDVESLKNEGRSEGVFVRIKVPSEDLRRAADIISVLDDVKQCDVVGAELSVTSELKEANFILAALIEANIHIMAMAEDRPDLEDVFIRSTKGKVT